jgi:hypothetical protein
MVISKDGGQGRKHNVYVPFCSTHILSLDPLFEEDGALHREAFAWSQEGCTGSYLPLVEVTRQIVLIDQPLGLT